VITVVLDDDPTGTQAVSDVLVVLDWSDPGVWDGVRADERTVHMLTNSRAHTGAEAGALVASAAAAARARHPRARLVLRGDSTLRAHVWEEYDALRAVVAGGRALPLLLVPALPAAGRVTIGGVHLIERDGVRVPLHETEYARDGGLAYSDADLARWADERSGGRLAAADAVRVPLERLRRPAGANDVAAAIAAAAAHGRPAAVIPDAETGADLRAIARGLRAAEEARIGVIVRCAPAFAAVLTGSGARTPAAAPRGDRGVLVVCGSFVPATTAQLEALARARPGAAIAADVHALAGDSWRDEADRLAGDARDRIDRLGLAVVATGRVRDPALVDPDAQRRVATALAQVARRVRAGVVVAKGGITAAVTARAGLDARVARVIGPILPGVALWRLAEGTDYVVVPGNVGGPGLLADVIAATGPRAAATVPPR
jgi:uncharacterized protein YgbK (DUF1537 family)